MRATAKDAPRRSKQTAKRPERSPWNATTGCKDLGGTADDSLGHYPAAFRRRSQSELSTRHTMDLQQTEPRLLRSLVAATCERLPFLTLRGRRPVEDDASPGGFAATEHPCERRAQRHLVVIEIAVTSRARRVR